MQNITNFLDRRQTIIYFAAIITAILVSTLTGLKIPETAINPALGLMLFATFLQVPLDRLRQAFRNLRFFAALLLANFILIPVLVFALSRLLPGDPLVQLGVLFVLLTPCVDYVLTFSHLGRADTHLLLAATPVLLLAQMLLLPVYLSLLAPQNTFAMLQAGPFAAAFVWLIVLPLLLATLLRAWAARRDYGKIVFYRLSILPVPATALVLCIIILVVWPQFSAAAHRVWQVIPIYVLFAVCAPLLGLLAARLMRLPVGAARALSFSTATRNSLVIMPLALTVPGAVPVIPTVIITQTIIELLSELAYIRVIPRIIK